MLKAFEKLGKRCVSLPCLGAWGEHHYHLNNSFVEDVRGIEDSLTLSINYTLGMFEGLVIECYIWLQQT